VTIVTKGQLRVSENWGVKVMGRRAAEMRDRGSKKRAREGESQG
jgi:hypothetical protein